MGKIIDYLTDRDSEAVDAEIDKNSTLGKLHKFISNNITKFI